MTSARLWCSFVLKTDSSCGNDSLRICARAVKRQAATDAFSIVKSVSYDSFVFLDTILTHP
jgi:hypothetical protein